MQEEFYAIAFRKKLYNSLEEMQQDIDQWLLHYNNERAHSGWYCHGKTPMQTFKDSKELAKVKDVNNLFGQSSTFKVSGEAETGAAAVQPARNNPTDENEVLRCSENDGQKSCLGFVKKVVVFVGHWALIAKCGVPSYCVVVHFYKL